MFIFPVDLHGLSFFDVNVFICRAVIFTLSCHFLYLYLNNLLTIIYFINTI